MHSAPLITTIAAALALALVLGFVAVRLRLPALVGYLVAGILIGPATPGFVADVGLAGQLAEIGVMLLMFGVGLHFSVNDLAAVRRIAVPGAVLQMAVATSLGFGVASMWGWAPGAGLVFGLALSVASTVVLLRALEARDALETIDGRIAVGWLVVEDVAMVLVLVLLPSLAGAVGSAPSGATPAGTLGVVGAALGRVVLFVGLMLVVGKRLLPWLLWQVARTASRELFTLCVIAVAVGIAYGSAKLFGVSFALGAFFAGMVVRESSLSHRAAAESLPFRDAFSVLFFVSVGMLFDPGMLMREPLRVLVVVAIIVLGKTLAAGVLVVVLRYPLRTALVVSASLAQIGEFSFILAALGVELGLLPEEGRHLILAGSLISIGLNPLAFGLVEPVSAWLRAHTRLGRPALLADDPLAELPREFGPDHLTGHVVVVGWGRVGSRVGEALLRERTPLVVVETNREIVERLRAANVAAVGGDAADAAVLVQAHVARARALLVTSRDGPAASRMAALARTLNPAIGVIVAARDVEEATRLRRERVGRVIVADEEMISALVRGALAPPSAEG